MNVYGSIRKRRIYTQHEDFNQSRPNSTFKVGGQPVNGSEKREPIVNHKIVLKMDSPPSPTFNRSPSFAGNVDDQTSQTHKQSLIGSSKGTLPSKQKDRRKQSEVSKLYHNTSTRIISRKELPIIGAKKIIKSTSKQQNILAKRETRLERNITNI